MKRVHDLPALPPRPDDAHKGSVGRIAVVAGRMDHFGMAGAAALTANAAFRSGAGLVRVFTSHAAQAVIVQLAPCATTQALAEGPEWIDAIIKEFGADVVAIGPGLDSRIAASDILELLTRFSGPIIVDADAINRLAQSGQWRSRWPGQVILTPHPGEMQRLLTGYKLDVDPNSRMDTASALSSFTGAVVIHKGRGTVVTDGNRLYVNGTGNSGMATAGAGDVLTGVVAGLLGSRMTAFDASVLGVYLHGLAGDIGAEELGRIPLTALDIIDYLPEAFSELEPDEE